MGLAGLESKEQVSEEEKSTRKSLYDFGNALGQYSENANNNFDVEDVFTP